MLVLASASPRRRELLRLIAPEFEVLSVDLDERAITADCPAALVEKLASAKAAAAAARRPDAVVLGCDTVVDLDGQVLGKPADRSEAEQMLRALSGRSHLVHTGVCAIPKRCGAHPCRDDAGLFLPPSVRRRLPPMSPLRNPTTRPAAMRYRAVPPALSPELRDVIST